MGPGQPGPERARAEAAGQRAAAGALFWAELATKGPKGALYRGPGSLSEAIQRAGREGPGPYVAMAGP